MWYFLHIPEDNKSVLRYTVSNCPVRSRSYITLIMTGPMLHGRFKKCCKVCLVAEILDLLYFLECSRLCYFDYVIIKASSLLLSTEAGPYLTEKKETWWGRWLQRTFVPSECVPFTWEMFFFESVFLPVKENNAWLLRMCCYLPSLTQKPSGSFHRRRFDSTSAGPLTIFQTRSGEKYRIESIWNWLRYCGESKRSNIYIEIFVAC